MLKIELAPLILAEDRQFLPRQERFRRSCSFVAANVAAVEGRRFSRAQDSGGSGIPHQRHAARCAQSHAAGVGIVGQIEVVARQMNHIGCEQSIRERGHHQQRGAVR